MLLVHEAFVVKTNDPVPGTIDLIEVQVPSINCSVPNTLLAELTSELVIVIVDWPAAIEASPAELLQVALPGDPLLSQELLKYIPPPAATTIVPIFAVDGMKNTPPES